MAWHRIENKKHCLLQAVVQGELDLSMVATSMAAPQIPSEKRVSFLDKNIVGPRTRLNQVSMVAECCSRVRGQCIRQLPNGLDWIIPWVHQSKHSQARDLSWLWDPSWQLIDGSERVLHCSGVRETTFWFQLDVGDVCEKLEGEATLHTPILVAYNPGAVR